MDLPYVLAPLIVSGLASILLGAVLVRGRRHFASRTFSLILLATMLWGVVIFGMRASPDVEHALPWEKAMVPIALAVFIFYYQFSSALTGAKKNWAVLLPAYLLLALVIALSPTDFFVQTMGERSYGYSAVLGYGVYLLGAAWTLLLSLTFYQLAKAYKASREYEERNRLLYVILAMVFPVVGLILDLFPIYPSSIFGNMAFCLFVSFAILRYHLLDIRIAVRKSLAYLMISGLVAIPYVSVILLVSVALAPSEIPIWIHASIILLLAFATQPLWRRVQRTADSLFYRRRYGHLRALEEFSRECTGIIELDKLSTRIVSLASLAMEVNGAYLLVRQDNEGNLTLAASSTSGNERVIVLDAESAIVTWLQRHDEPLRQNDLDFLCPLEAITVKERNMLESMKAELLIPFRYREKLTGVLILGPKLSEEPYGVDDIATLMVLARQASTAIENAYLYTQSQQMALRDGLTGLYNHRYFQERLREEIERGRRLNRPVTLMMLDIDMFHLYNELHGHADGDRALAELAQVLHRVARKTDLLFRYGGEEFAMLVPGQEASQVRRLGERVRKAIEAHPFPGLAKERGMLTISVGIASHPKHAPDAETLVFCADLALLEAKRKGRNVVALYAPMKVALAPSEDLKRAALENSSQVAYVSTILALAAAIDAKDPCTYGHSQKVARYAVLLGEAVGLGSDQLGSLRITALLHDIGKIGIPDSLLRKPGRFSPKEMEEMQRHPKQAEGILNYVPSLSSMLPHIVHHHECFDGSGYPDGLAGNDIPLESRILAIADAFDAITSQRAYRSARSEVEAIGELRRCAGDQFDPDLVEVFCSVLERNPQVVGGSDVKIHRTRRKV